MFAVPLQPLTRKSNDFVAQLVEQLTLNQWVEGSSPSEVTNDGSALTRLAHFFFVCFLLAVPALWFPARTACSREIKETKESYILSSRIILNTGFLLCTKTQTQSDKYTSPYHTQESAA